ncbi:PTS fructose transporter subunit IIA [Allobaculum stercoricanis]|uniref:PTS sugar transporter subunit IIA n=1 Tax=Allobaculum stercoricanis TaxID=174709 RepID=UPI002942D585|nr:PTS fructose transporter subunit IIA [Allobaculum stercoricanis]
MKYIILVSHGEFANGLKNALSMLAGDRENLIACGLKDGKSADEFALEFEAVVQKISLEDEVLLFGDLIGGSPLTTACNVLVEKGFGQNLRIVGGMNLPAILSDLLSVDFMDLDMLKETALSEGKNALAEFVLASVTEEEDI